MKKKHLKRNIERPESMQQKFDRIDGEVDIPDFRDIAKPESLIDIEKGLVQRSLKFKTVRNGSDGRVAVCDEAARDCFVPNDPQYVGFQQASPNRLTTIPEQILRHFGHSVSFIGWQACAYLATHNFIGKACIMPGDDALDAGYTVAPRVAKNKKLLADLVDIATDDNFDINETLRKFEYNKRCFGFAVAIPAFAEDVDMSKPLVDYSQLAGKTFLGWSIIDPYWLMPEFDEEAERNPASRRYFKPTWWKVNGRGRSIHYTWIIQANNTMLADVVSPTYLWGGISIPQLCYERVYCADKCANESQMVAMSKRLVAITGCNTRKMAANPEYSRRQMEAFEMNRDNWGAIALGAGQDIKQLDTILSEFNQLITTQYQLFCGIVEVPAPKMMMTPLTGFANHGDYEWKVYATNLRKIQNRDYSPLLRRTYRILAACAGVDMRVDINWNPIDVPTLVEKADIDYNEARGEKFRAEAKAVTKMANAKSAESHKGMVEQTAGE